MLQSKNQGFTLTELLVVIAIVGILSAIALPSLLRFIARWRLEAATHQVQMWFRQTQYDAIAERIPRTLCIRDVPDRPPELAPIIGTDCESEVKNWIKLPWGVSIDHENSTLRTVKGVAGNGGSIYRASFAQTKAGFAGSYGQLGRVTFQTWWIDDKTCIFLYSVDGKVERRDNKKCKK